MSTKLYAISPENIRKVIDLDKLVITDTDQSITGTKTFTNIELSDKFSIRNYAYGHGEDHPNMEQTIIGYMGDYPGQDSSNWESRGAKIALHYDSKDFPNDGSCIIRASDGTHFTDFVIKTNGSIEINDKSINNGSFMHVEEVSAIFNNVDQLCAYISAPYVDGYKFLCWCMYSTIGVVEMCYINKPTQQINAEVWMKFVGGDYSHIIDRSIHAAALYVRKDL